MPVHKDFEAIRLIIQEELEKVLEVTTKTDKDFEAIRSIIQEELEKVLEVTTKTNSRMSRTEAAEYLGVKYNTLSVWASEGRGPAPTKVGRKVYYLRTELDHYLAENTAPRRSSHD